MPYQVRHDGNVNSVATRQMVICEGTRLRGDDIWVVKTPLSVIPAKAGTHGHGRPAWHAITSHTETMGSGFRRDDDRNVISAK